MHSARRLLTPTLREAALSLEVNSKNQIQICYSTSQPSPAGQDIHPDLVILKADFTGMQQKDDGQQPLAVELEIPTQC